MLQSAQDTRSLFPLAVNFLNPSKIYSYRSITHNHVLGTVTNNGQPSGLSAEDTTPSSPAPRSQARQGPSPQQLVLWPCPTLCPPVGPSVTVLSLPLVSGLSLSLVSGCFFGRVGRVPSSLPLQEGNTLHLLNSLCLLWIPVQTLFPQGNLPFTPPPPPHLQQICLLHSYRLIIPFV